MKIGLSLVLSLQLVALGARAAEHDHMAMLKAFLEANAVHGPVIPQPAAVDATAAKTFNMVARSFQFDITPSPFVVDQGDVVTINLSVPQNDLASQHGLLMDTYVENAVIVDKGKSKTITFTATTIGTFPFVCAVPSCGIGHDNMFGTLIVRQATLPAPAISSVTPSSGVTTGVTVVTIAGSNFNSATVTFGGNAATIRSSSATSLEVSTPAHAAGAVAVVVTNGDGQSATRAGGFTYVLPNPTVASITPGTGPTSGNTFVTIAGANFQPGATVTIGGVPATNVTVVDATTITAMTPLGPTNELPQARDVVVTNPDNNKATLAGAFQYTRPPLSVAMITPTAALVAGGSKIAISGAGFTNALALSVTVGGVAATNVTVVDAVTITATVPPHAAGPVDVVVNNGTSVTAKGLFAYMTALPRHRPAKH